MNQTIEIDQYTSVEVYGNNYTIVKINNLHNFIITLELDNYLVDEIAGKIYKKLQGYYPEDKISELEYEINELKEDNERLQELLDEAVLESRGI